MIIDVFNGYSQIFEVYDDTAEKVEKEVQQLFRRYPMDTYGTNVKKDLFYDESRKQWSCHVEIYSCG